MMELPLHRTIIVVDIAGFTSSARTSTHQDEMHGSLYRMLAQAFVEAGIDLTADDCVVADRGDGVLVLLSPDIPKRLVADRLPDRLEAGLKRHNAIHSEAAVVQLRVALHDGEVQINEHGVVSPAVNFTFRIVDAEDAKNALRRSNATLAIIASDRFYQEVIRQDPAANPDQYTRIAVEVKETSSSAWLLLRGQRGTGPLVSDGLAHRPRTFTRVDTQRLLVTVTENDGFAGEVEPGYPDPDSLVLGDGHRPATGDRTQPAIPASKNSTSVEEVGPARVSHPEPRHPGGTPATLPIPSPVHGEQFQAQTRDERVPAFWGDVPPRNILFTGRIELLDRLRERLSAGRTTAVLPAALHEMGGIGKTQVAVEYVYRHLDDYDIVWWIQAAQMSQVRKALAELARQLDLPGSSEVHTAVPAVREALRSGEPYSRWLLVFDAAESVDVIREYFPTNGPGQILITSRNPEWARVADPLEVTVFRREESVALLRKRGPDIYTRDADELAEKLGDLPLAVAQAAAWRAATGMPVSEYLKLFDEKVVEISSRPAPAVYEIPVSAAWDVSSDVLEKRNPAAHQLLQVCAFFAPEPITRTLFNGVRGIRMSPELEAALRDPMHLGRAIRDINRYSLAKIDHRTNTLQLHRLVQVVLRNRMSEEMRHDRQHVAHVLLANLDPNEPRSSKWWPRYQDIWPHVYSSDLVQCDDAWVRQLVINLMQFLYFWGDHSEAAELAARALERWRVALGDTDLQVLEASSYLGLYLWALGRYSEAAELNLRTLEARMRVSGQDSEETIIAELRVAVDVRTAGDFLRARELNERIYEKAHALYGGDDPVTLQTAHDLAVSIRLCGDYRRAYELDRKTSERRAEVLGYDSVDTLNTQSGMYIDLRELGDYKRARDEHEKFTERVRELLGENRWRQRDKADTLRRLVYLAVARRKAGDHHGAIELSKHVIELLRNRYGDDHPNTMACALAYSIDLRHAGDLDEAQSFGEGTHGRYRDNLGERHPHTMAAAIDLAVTFRMRGDAVGAQQVDERCLEELRIVLGPDHPYAMACAINLASDLAALKNREAALSLGVEALERARRVLGSDHPTALAAGLNVALDLKSVGREAEARSQHAATIERYRYALGEEHPATIGADQQIRANCEIDPLPS
ncbi:FxSxx-COOH system tetratricopeptide repeat protein [Actinophytocola sp.]|uniref:FxSxx-COOH system tetratricopeptide repeat protein n=1 Tax=Actinophytocola sp. TaxID=1872138 RepID=UPI003D6BBA05